MQRAPRFVFMSRDFYRSFFGLRTNIDFFYGTIEQGSKIVLPLLLLMYIARSKELFNR
jgi:hypothetical protein